MVTEDRETEFIAALLVVGAMPCSKETFKPMGEQGITHWVEVMDYERRLERYWRKNIIKMPPAGKRKKFTITVDRDCDKWIEGFLEWQRLHMYKERENDEGIEYQKKVIRAARTDWNRERGGVRNKS